MRAVGYQTPLPLHDPASLADIDLPKPAPYGRDLLVEIRAISVNPVDTKVRQRPKPDPESWAVLGWDAAGVVQAVGPDATLFKPGDAVFYARRPHPPGHQRRIPPGRRADRRPQARLDRLGRGRRPAADRHHRVGGAVRPAGRAQAGARRTRPRS